MHHLHIGGQQILDAVARDGVGVTAAKFHELVVATGDRFFGDRGGDRARQGAVAVFVDVLHAAAASLAERPGTAASRMRARVRSASSGSSRVRA